MDKRKRWIIPCLHKKAQPEARPSGISDSRIDPPQYLSSARSTFDPAYMITDVNRR
jgi:hypothetical protein